MRRSSGCRHSSNDATESQARDDEPKTPLRVALIVGALAVLLRRQQESLWRQAKADLDLLLTRTPAWQLTQVIEGWSIRWRGIAQSNQANLRLAIRLSFDQSTKQVAGQVNRQLKRIDRELTPQEQIPIVDNVSSATTGLAVAAIVTQFVRQIERVQDLGQRAALTGQTPTSLLESVGTLVVQDRKKALQQARDITGTQAAAVQRQSFDKAGVTRAIWRTQGDKRVRPTHRARNSREFDTDKGLEGIWPGQEINCRCWAEPVR